MQLDNTVDTSVGLLAYRACRGQGEAGMRFRDHDTLDALLRNARDSGNLPALAASDGPWNLSLEPPTIMGHRGPRMIASLARGGLCETILRTHFHGAP